MIDVKTQEMKKQAVDWHQKYWAVPGLKCEFNAAHGNLRAALGNGDDILLLCEECDYVQLDAPQAIYKLYITHLKEWRPVLGSNYVG